MFLTYVPSTNVSFNHKTLIMENLTDCHHTKILDTPKMLVTVGIACIGKKVDGLWSVVHFLPTFLYCRSLMTITTKGCM